jgi:WD40 repeat protein
MGGNNKGNVTRVDENMRAQTRDFPGRGPVVAAHIDPNNPLNVLIVWSRGAWALFDPLTITAVHEVSGLSHLFSCSVWNPAVPGQFITGEANCGVLRFWSAAGDAPINSITLHSAGIGDLVLLPSGRVLVSFEDGMISVYDFVARQFVFQNRPAHTDCIVSLRFLPSSNDTFVTAGQEGALCVWSASAMRQLDRIPPLDDDSALYAMDVSPSGGHAACGYHNGSLVVFSLLTRMRLFDLALAPKPIVNIAFDPTDPGRCFCVAKNGFVCTVDIERRAIATIYQSGFVRFCGFSPVSKTLAFLGDEGKIRVLAADAPSPNGIFKTITAFGWSATEHSVMAVAGEGYNILLWNFELNVFKLIAISGSEVLAIAFHPIFSTIVASAGKDGLISVHDTEQRVTLGRICAHAGSIGCLQFAPDNPHLLISASNDASIKFWSLDRIFLSSMVTHILQCEAIWIRPLEGNQQLVKLARRVCKKTGEKIVFESSDITHVNDIVRLTSKFVRNSLSGSSGETRLIKRAIRSKGKMIQAARQELRMGNVKRYCELMFAGGEYEAAVAAAPAVSHAFWREMVKNRAKLADTPDDAARAMVLAGALDDAIAVLLGADMDEKAFLLAAARRKGAFEATVKAGQPFQPAGEFPYIDREFTDARLFDEYRTASARARLHLVDDEIYLAAASYLAIGDLTTAELLLLKLGQTPTAFLIDTMTGLRNRRVRERFAMFAIQVGVTKPVFSSLDEEEKMRVVISLPFASAEDREEFYANIQLRPLADYQEKSATAEPLLKVHFLLLAGNAGDALAFCIDYIRDNLSLKFVEVREIIQLMELAFLPPMYAEQISIIILVSLYFACYAAAWKGYTKIFDRLKCRIQDSSASPPDWLRPFTLEAVRMLDMFSAPGNETRIYAMGHRFLNMRSLGISFSPNTKHGNFYWLEDVGTVLPMELVLMWFDLTPFSPNPVAARHYII